MSFGLCFWIVMLVWLLFGFWSKGFGNPRQVAGDFILFFLLVLIGWKLFGAPLHG